MKWSAIEWQTETERKKKKRPEWYIAISIIALSLIATAILLDNLLFVPIIILCVVTLFLNTTKNAKIIHAVISKKGIILNDNFFPYRALESFYVNDHQNLLFLKPNERWTSTIIIPIEGIETGAIRDYLSEFLPEEEMHEPFSAKIMEYLGF